MLNEEGKAGDHASARLAGLVGHAEPIRLKDKFFAVRDSLDLDRSAMKKHFDAWWAERNALMHGTWGDHDDDFANQARIAGLINILLLKFFGYAGRVVAARFGVPPAEVYLTI